jgi:hypothetical protein
MLLMLGQKVSYLTSLWHLILIYRGLHGDTEPQPSRRLAIGSAFTTARRTPDDESSREGMMGNLEISSSGRHRKWFTKGVETAVGAERPLPQNVMPRQKTSSAGTPVGLADPEMNRWSFSGAKWRSDAGIDDLVQHQALKIRQSRIPVPLQPVAVERLFNRPEAEDFVPGTACENLHICTEMRLLHQSATKSDDEMDSRGSA